MNGYRFWLIAIAVLVLLAPLASQRPDAVQRVLRLSGGASTIAKAVLGILIVYGSVWGLMKLLRRRERR